MEPNELDLLPTDGLVRLILSARDSRAQYVLPKHDDGVTLDFEQYRFIELSHELARRTTALQAQIDGMIERPVVEAPQLDNGDDCMFGVTINGDLLFKTAEDDAENTCDAFATRIRQALGMDEAKEGGEG